MRFDSNVSQLQRKGLTTEIKSSGKSCLAKRPLSRIPPPRNISTLYDINHHCVKNFANYLPATPRKDLG